MHTSVIQSPQAMSSNQSYRPRSPDLPGLSDSQQQQQQQQQQQNQQQSHPRLSRLPSYQIQEPTLPKGYSFSPRGSYDASPFFSQGQSNQPPSFPFNYQSGHSYPEQSPPRFPPASLPEQSQVFSPISYHESPQRHQVANFFPNQQFGFPPSQSQIQNSSQLHQLSADEMARLRSRKPVNYNEDHNGAKYEEPIQSYPPPHMMQPIPPQPQQLMQQPPAQQFIPQPIFQPPVQQMPVQLPPQPIAPPMPLVDVKTKFPVARIKRIMQADEDVGKVAQATPTAVSKALELFMIALVTKGAAAAKEGNSKRVTATHLKHALLSDPQFDFLNEICESVPDEGSKGSKSRAKSEAKSEDSDEDMGGASKKKTKARRKKGGDDDGSD